MTDTQAPDVVVTEADRGYDEAEAMLRDLLTPDLISDTAIRVARDHMMQFLRRDRLSTQFAKQARIEELEAAVNDSQATLLAIKADCAARIEWEEDQMASHIVDICQQTMLSNRATLSNISEKP